MRALRFHQNGHPSQVLRLDEVLLPQPGPGEVRVRLTARPVNPSDLLYIQGRYGRPVALPATAGFEGAGYVQQQGPDAQLPLGTRVAIDLSGTWQESVIATVRDVVVLPSQIDDATACQLTINPYTAWGILHQLSLPTGQLVLQTAGTSAVGNMIAWAASELGLRTISTCRRDPPNTAAPRPPTDILINTERQPLAATVDALTGGAGVAAVIDAVGGEPAHQTLKCLQSGGAFLSYGLLSGEAVRVPSQLLIFEGVRLEGFWLPVYLNSLSPTARESLDAQVLDSVSSGLFSLRVAKSFDLGDFSSALEYSMNGHLTGKILLTG